MIDEATRIRTVRAIMGVSSTQFAGIMGVSRFTVTNWEKGHAVPQQPYRVKLASVCQECGIEFRDDGMPVPVRVG